MFGPNTQQSCSVEVSGSHRDKAFEELLHTCRTEFQFRFSLQDYDILFIPGSASVGMEAVIASLRYGGVSPYSGRFGERWDSVLRHHGKLSLSGHQVYCHLETSESRLNECPTEKLDDSIVDCVSSFPYYNIPLCAVFVTCMNKQIGALSGLSIVGVRKDKWDMFCRNNLWSYLSLPLFLNNNPVTFPTYLFEPFLSRITEHHLEDVRKHIEIHSELIQRASGKGRLIGECPCPVLTFKRGSLPESLVKKWELHPSPVGHQVFTYSDKVAHYFQFAEELRQC